MFKRIIKIFNDCTRGRTGKYSYERIGAVIVESYLLIMTTIAIIFYIKNTPHFVLQEVGEMLWDLAKESSLVMAGFGGALAAKYMATNPSKS